MQSWYKSYWRLITHPYAFFEEQIMAGHAIPSTVFFLISLAITLLGWFFIMIATHGILFPLWSQFLLAVISYPLAIISIFMITRLFVRETRLRSFFTVWGFSYLPTLVFFCINISAHLLLSVPLVKSIIGIPLMLLIIWAILLLLFLWKLLLLAITLRLAGNLNTKQIIIAIALLLVLTALYWWGLIYYQFGKVPFL